MPKKPMKKKKMADEEMADESAEKIGLKGQKEPGSEDMDARWEKVESIVSAAKEAYTSGNSSFGAVVESMIATLQDLRASEEGQGEMGGLGVGGPEMALPPEAGAEQEEELQ